MDKKLKVLLAAILIIVSPPRIAFGLVINEIMYDLPGTDTKGEWLEIYNESSEQVKIETGSTNSAWRFSDGTQHTMAVSNGGSAIMNPGSYAIIASDPTTFLSAWPTYSGLLIDSSFALNNTGSAISLRSSKDGPIVVETNYNSQLGAAGDGNTLQRTTEGTWIAGEPTPGYLNTTIPAITQATSSTESTSTNQQGGSYSAHSSQSSLSNADDSHVSIGAGRKRLAVVGEPIEFRVQRNDTSPNMLYTWNFGDGVEGFGDIVSHSYLFPGEYNVVLHGHYAGQESVSRTIAKVIEADILLNVKPSYLEIKNKGKEEINLGNWKLSCDKKVFSFPKDTIVAAESSTKIPALTTKCESDSKVWVLAGSSGLKISSLEKLNSKELAKIKLDLSKISESIANLKEKALFNEDRLENEIIPEKERVTQVKKDTELIILDGKKHDGLWASVRKWFVK